MKRAGLALLLTMTAGCVEIPAIERGEELFSDPAFSPSDRNAVACSTCHSAGPVPAGAWRSGGSLTGVSGRPSYFGGEVLELREAVNFCLRYFMRHPELEPLSSSDPRGRDLLTYLDSLGTEPSEPVAFTIQREVVDDLPLGDATRGATVYAGACRNCHGDQRTGAGRLNDLVSIIPNETMMIHGDTARIATIEKVRHGEFYGAGGTMAPWSLETLPPQDLADVLAFMSY